MKSVLICHEGALLTKEGIGRWLASFTDLAGVVVIKEGRDRKMKRIKREISRIGYFRFLDVVAFKFYYKFFVAAKDDKWTEKLVNDLKARYPALPPTVKFITVENPNSRESEEFIKSLAPDFILARCKTLLSKCIFTLPTKGTFVMHPGICPEYRNSHGCFWALAQNDTENVGMTLLQIDTGVDTGPIYAYYSYPYDEVNESHIIIQARVVTNNLDDIAQKFKEICDGTAIAVDISGRSSAAYGQPWLTKYLYWKKNAKRRKYQ